MKKTTWRRLITAEMQLYNDSWENVDDMAIIHPDSLHVEFNSGFGSPEGDSFTVWTTTRVYFPTEYDGFESCCSVSRHPNGEPTSHV